jgi:hypothetical protein
MNDAFASKGRWRMMVLAAPWRLDSVERTKRRVAIRERSIGLRFQQIIRIQFRLGRRDQRAVRCESGIWRREICVPRHRGFDGVRLIDFLVSGKIFEPQFNF